MTSIREKFAEPVDAREERFTGQERGSQLYLEKNPPRPVPATVKQDQEDITRARNHDTWVLILFVRMVNAVTICTFFQPDEYYQALEPAWALAFGKDSGAWLTWEWQHQLRSSLHPILISVVYKATAMFSNLIFPPVLKTKYLVLLPKFALAMQAAVMDYYTWALSEKIFGAASTESTIVLRFLLLSPWQWFMSTRAFSNTLETALTVLALYYWPWAWMKPAASSLSRGQDTKNLKWSILLAAIAVTLRPTNGIVWVVLTLVTVNYAKQDEFFSFVKDVSIYGSTALGAAQALDRWYYGSWTTPAVNWLYFNLRENIASFYGMNRPAYYFTEGLIWLMLVGSPFAVIGVYQSLTGRLQVSPTTTPPNPAIPRTLAMVALALPATLSLISHKEVRFIYPIFPILIILLSGPVASFYHPFPSPPSRFRRILLFGTLIFNFIAIIFFGYIHQRGVKSVMGFLRSEFENHNPELVTLGRTDSITRMSVGVLMPCHSIPWRSHLVYPEIDAWALTCEPPLGMSEEAKKSYLDEADVFYEDPSTWITQNVGAGKPREWPEYLLLFGQLEKGLKTSVPGGMYEECWRGFNSFWHDDPRRKGDVIVWCRKQSVVR